MKRSKTLTAALIAAMLMSIMGCSSEARRESEYLNKYVEIISTYSQKATEGYQTGEAKSTEGLELFSQGETETAQQVFTELSGIIDDILKDNKKARAELSKLKPPAKMKKLHGLTLDNLDAWRKFMLKDQEFVESYTELKPSEKLRNDALKLSDDFRKIDAKVQAEFNKVTR